MRTWKLVFHKTGDIEQHHPKFWLDVQSVADQISRKGKGWQREEGYKGGYKGQDKGKEGYKGKERDKGDTREDTRARTRARASTRAKVTPRTPS